MDKKILVITYKFPPYEGIAARRWAKFLKYFSKKNIEVHVITTKWYNQGKLSWTNDIKNKGVIIHALSNPLYNLQNTFPWAFNFLDKSAQILRYNVFSYFDEAHFWTIIHKQKIKKIIRNNDIKYVIATGPPYSVNCFAANLKTEIKGIKVIQDIRDPWTDDLYFKINTKKFKTQKKAEITMLNNSDAVVAVTNSLLEIYKKKCTNAAVKFKTIYNGYDPDDASINSEKEHKIILEEKHINICYFGSIGAGRENQLLKFANVLSKQGKETYSKFRITTFGSIDNNMDKIIRKLPAGDIFNFYSFISGDQIQYYMKVSTIHMSINSEIYPYAFGTKVYDAFLYKKKVLLISPEGELYNLIKNNALGYVTDGSDDQTKLIISQIISDHNNAERKESSSSFNYNQFSIPNLSEEYLDFLNKI